MNNLHAKASAALEILEDYFSKYCLAMSDQYDFPKDSWADRQALQLEASRKVVSELREALLATPTPLSVDTIGSTFDSLYLSGYQGRDLEVRFARAIEAAHGIG